MNYINILLELWKARSKVIGSKWNARPFMFWVGLKPAMRISDLIRDVKNNSTNFINEKRILKQKFFWQDGYGAFSYSESNFGNVIDYIKNQKEHDKKKTFRREYLGFLKKF
jgi:putative transposase